MNTRPTANAAVRPPDAVLLDFNGIITETITCPDRLRGVADQIHKRLVVSGETALSVEEIHDDLRSGQEMHRAWRAGTVRRSAPRSIGHREFWAEFVAADWPEGARQAVMAQATELTRLLHSHGKTKHLRSGIPAFLRLCRSHDIPVAIVSNTFMGELTRQVARNLDVEKFFAVQVFSDEVGMTKPNPEMILSAVDALGKTPPGCWFVGDQLNRDVLGPRRAGIGTVILMHPAKRNTAETSARVEPDVVVSSPADLVDLLGRATKPQIGE